MNISKNNRGYLVLCIILGFTVLSLIAVLVTVKLYTPEQTVQNTTQTVSDAKKDYLYCIREYDGKIGVFCPGQDTPVKTIETDPKMLPEYDRTMLKDGIYINSEEELRKITEDFDG